jgi:putative exosortase-associated protein (TIGR04073 family)
MEIELSRAVANQKEEEETSMKQFIALTLAVAFLCTMVYGMCGDCSPCDPCQPCVDQYDNCTGDLITKGMQRSIANIMVSPAEIPHYIIKDLNEYSLVGFVTGPVKGTIYGVSRLVAGLADLLTLGLLPADGDPYDSLCVKPVYLERMCCQEQEPPCPEPFEAPCK